MNGSTLQHEWGPVWTICSVVSLSFIIVEYDFIVACTKYNEKYILVCFHWILIKWHKSATTLCISNDYCGLFTITIL